MAENIFSQDPQDEFNFEYRPSIIYNPRELNTIDNSGKQATEGSIDYSTATSLSKRYINNNAVELISLFNKKQRIFNSLLSDISQYLLDSNFSVKTDFVLPDFYKEFIFNNSLSFKEYQNIPKTEDFQFLHDIWFKESVKISGNLVAELYPIISDTIDDLKRIEFFGNEFLLYNTPFSFNDSLEEIKRFFIEKAESYENSFGKLIEAQESGNIKVVNSIKRQSRELESELKIDSEINGLLKNSILMLEDSLKNLGPALYKEIDGDYREESLTEINKLRNISSFTREETLIPLMYGYKKSEKEVIKDRMAENTQYSNEIKRQNQEKIIISGKTWKKICIPDIAKYLTIGYNKDKILSHLADGIEEVNRELVDGLKDFYRISLGDMFFRKKISSEMAYKNMARHIYQNISGGL